MHQVEDVIFVDKKHLVSLEYIYYQKDGNYKEISVEKDQKDFYPLGIENYDPKQRGSVIKAFKNEPENFLISNRGYLEQNRKKLITTNYESVESIEALIGLYRVTPTGQIEKVKETPFYYNAQFHQTKEGKMRLKLSQDKTLISIVTQNRIHQEAGVEKYFDQGDLSSELSECEINENETGLEYVNEASFKKAEIQIFAWEKLTLKQIFFEPTLTKNMREQPMKQLLNLMVVGKYSQYILQIALKHSHKQDKKIQWMEYTIFDRSSGAILFQFENNVNEHNIRCMGFMSYAGDEIQVDPEIATPSKISKQAQNKNLAEDNISPGKVNLLQYNLNLAFFFVKPLSPGKKSSFCDDCKSGNGSKCFDVVNKFINLSELVNLEKDRQKSFIFQQALHKFNQLDKGTFISNKAIPEMENSFHLPKDWFVNEQGEEENWNVNIQINATCNFHNYAFINQQKRVYIAKLIHQNHYNQMKIQVPKHAEVSHGRNQVTKNHLFLIQKVRNEESSATVIFNHQTAKTMFFENDYFFCSPDVIQISKYQNADNIRQDQILLQAVTLSAGDQNIQLLTFVDGNQDNEQKKVVRKTTSQFVNARFPILAFNIGLRKVIFQSTLNQGTQFVYHIRPNEHFISFVKYANLSSLGFNAKGLRIETASQIVFLTLNTENHEIFVYLFFIDPYYQPCQIVLFKSRNSFPKTLTNYQSHDLCVNNFIFSTAKNVTDENFEVKLLSQYNNHFTIQTMNFCQDDLYEFDFDDCDYILDQKLLPEENQDNTECQIAPVKIIMDVKGSIYYLLIEDGQCVIKQIIPSKSEVRDHLVIFEIKSDSCLGFGVSDSGEYFFFIDDFKMITLLKRIQDSKWLQEHSLLQLKDKDRTHLKIEEEFANIIISDTYIIFQSKIFYTYKDKPLANGILDMEKLNQTVKVNSQSNIITEKFHLGPIPNDGNNEFVVVYIDNVSFRIKTRFYQQPDSYDVSLLADYQKKVEFSTFIKTGEILLKIMDRYMIFDNTGNFIYQVVFDDIEQFQPQSLIDRLEDLKKTKKKRRSEFMANSNQKLRLVDSKKESKEPGLNRRNTKIEFEGGKKESPTKLEWKDQSKIIRQGSTVRFADLPDGPEVDQENEDTAYELSSEDDDDLFEEEKEITQWNRMKIIKMSRDNTFFLFQDRLKKTFKVYRLEQQTQEFKNGSQKIQQRIYKFMPQYEVDVLKMKMMRNYFCSPKVTFESIIRHMTVCGIIKIDDSGSINVTFNTYRSQFNNSKFYIHGSILKKSTSKRPQSQLFTMFDEYVIKEKIQFEPDGMKGMTKATTKLLENQTNLHEIETINQFNLPQNLKDPKKLELILNKMRELKLKLQNNVCQQIIGQEVKILVVNCGPFIQYAILENEQLQQNPANKKPLRFKFVNISFKPETEILRIWGTSNNNHIQIIGKDIVKNLIIIVTWDIISNMEVDIYQIQCTPDTYPENYIVRGMNMKSNYYVSKHYIIDLSNNLPVQVAHGNSLVRPPFFKKEPNMRKIFVNNSRMLNIDNQKLLTFATNRMDNIFWKNINDLGERPGLINESTQLNHFNHLYSGQSLFHYFVQNSEIIEGIHNKYMNAYNNKILKEEEMYMPLVLLQPDNEGNTALELAQLFQRVQVFDLMLNLLINFNDFSFSRMMLRVLPRIIRQDTLVVERFIENCIFQPITMRQQMIVPCSTETFIFASHTSMITLDMLMQELNDDYEPETQVSELDPNDTLNASQISASAKSEKDSIKKYKKTRTFHIDLGEETDEEEEEKEKKDECLARVSLNAVDFNWIFEGKNCENLLGMLVKNGNKSLFKNKAIKTFINLLWKYYQPEIVRRIFFPYGCYLVVQMLTSSGFAGAYFKIILLPQEEQDLLEATKLVLSTYINCITIIAYVLWSFFFWIEIMQMYASPSEYFTDFWNYVDITSQLTSFSFFCALNITTFFDIIIVDITRMRLWGGFACFLLWVKMFQWMRLFQSTAHFISLISQILTDLKMFNFMWLIVMLAFGNFYYTLNNNSAMTQDSHYVGKYTYLKFVDAIIEMYIFSLGEFDLESQRSGPNHIVGFILFVLSSFVLCVVFLNLIIAIISNTYNNSKLEAEENGLLEQATLIKDMMWLVDMQELFKGKRYIILMTTVSTLKQEEVDFQVEISKFQMQMMKQGDQNLQVIMKNLDNFEKSSRSMQKANYTVALKNKEQMNDYEKKLNKYLSVETNQGQKQDPLSTKFKDDHSNYDGEKSVPAIRKPTKMKKSIAINANSTDEEDYAPASDIFNPNTFMGSMTMSPGLNNPLMKTEGIQINVQMNSPSPSRERSFLNRTNEKSNLLSPKIGGENFNTSQLLSDLNGSNFRNYRKRLYK